MKAVNKDRYLVLAGTSLLVFFMYPTIFSIPPLLPLIIDDLGLTNAQGGLIYSSPLIAFIVLVNLGGALCDKIGPIKVTALGGLILSVGSLLRAISTDFPTFMIFTLITGAGLGMSVPNLPKIIGSWFPPNLTGTATGVYTTTLTVGEGLAIALSLPISIMLSNSWRYTISFWSILVLFAVVIFWILLRSTKYSSKRMDLYENQSTPTTPSNPFWKNRGIWILGVLFSIANLMYYALVGWLPTFFSERGMIPTTAAFITSSMILLSIPAIILIPLASDKIGLRKPFLWSSFLVMAVSCLALLITPLNLTMLTITILGLSLAIPFVLGFVLPIELVQKEYVGRATGLILSIAYIGAIIGPWFTGFIKDISAEFTNAFVIISVIAIIAMGLSLTMPETGWKKSKFKEQN